jgi:hypothetical protein
MKLFLIHSTRRISFWDIYILRSSIRVGVGISSSLLLSVGLYQTICPQLFERRCLNLLKKKYLSLLAASPSRKKQKILNFQMFFRLFSNENVVVMAVELLHGARSAELNAVLFFSLICFFFESKLLREGRTKVNRPFLLNGFRFHATTNHRNSPSFNKWHNRGIGREQKKTGMTLGSSPSTSLRH